MPEITCPKCYSPMKLRRGSYGSFYGCTKYPTCRGTRNASEAAATAPAAAPSNGADAPINLDDHAVGNAEPVAAAPKAAERFALLAIPTEAEARTAHAALIDRLDADQAAVVAWKPEVGNLRVVAAAGSGKTTTTVALVGRLVWAGIAAAGEIVATTFTRKAADELITRLVAVLPPGSFNPSSPGAPGTLRAGTFHALALATLRQHDGHRWNMSRCLGAARRAAGVPSEAALWAKVLGYAGPEGVPGLGVEGLGLEDADTRSYMLAVDCARSSGIRGDALLASLRKTERESGLAYLVQAHETVERAKAALGAFSFGDILSGYLDALRDGSISDGAKVVIVDEAQDNSAEQIEIATLLARNGGGHVLLVGDVRQAIYEWRGAAPELMQHADEKLGAATLELRHNYRSASSIVALGNRVAEGKAWSLGSASIAARADAGTITVDGYADPGEEGAAIASSIRSALDEGASLNDEKGAARFAVLVRTNAAAGSIEAAMVAAKIPAVVVGGQPFFSRREVMDVLAYVKLASGADDMEAFGRIVNRPRRYLGKAFVAKVAAAGGSSNLIGALDSAIGGLYRRQQDAARDLRAFISELRAAEWPAQVEMVAKLLAPTDAADGEADSDRSGIPAAVADVGRQFASAGEFLAFADRCRGEVTEAQGTEALGYEIPKGRVVISTVHKAKGLEWENVYVSASTTVFPHARAVAKPRQLAGEERLFYVAATRAKTALHFTWAYVNLFGKDAGPSPFLSYVERDNEPSPVPPQGPQGGGKPVEPAPAAVAAPVAAPAAPAAAGPIFDAVAWQEATAHADAEAAATPASVDGSRFVQPTSAQFSALLAPLGFKAKADERSEQIVYSRAHGEYLIKVYTTIPTDAEAAREVGEDSIKVAAIWTGRADGHKPLHKRLPYAMRTRGWRLAVLSKIAEVAAIVVEADTHRCKKCNSPTVARRKADGSTSFRGCVRYPDCK